MNYKKLLTLITFILVVPLYHHGIEMPNMWKNIRMWLPFKQTMKTGAMWVGTFGLPIALFFIYAKLAERILEKRVIALEADYNTLERQFNHTLRNQLNAERDLYASTIVRVKFLLSGCTLLLQKRISTDQRVRLNAVVKKAEEIQSWCVFVLSLMITRGT